MYTIHSPSTCTCAVPHVSPQQVRTCTYNSAGQIGFFSSDRFLFIFSKINDSIFFKGMKKKDKKVQEKSAVTLLLQRCIVTIISAFFKFYFACECK